MAKNDYTQKDSTAFRVYCHFVFLSAILNFFNPFSIFYAIIKYMRRCPYEDFAR